MKRLWWRLRLAVKDFWCYSGWGSSLIEYCEDCGIRQPVVWWSPNDLWAELVGRPAVAEPHHDGGILCPNCFDRRAERKGMLLRWRPTIQNRNVSEGSR